MPAASPEDFAAAWAGHDVFVAVAPNGGPVGYAAATPLDGFLHLAELSVDPDHGRIGIGAALVEAVAALADRRGLPGVTLTTFRDIPFNAPFYARLGFVELPLSGASALQRERFLAELPPRTPFETRVLMLRRL